MLTEIYVERVFVGNTDEQILFALQCQIRKGEVVAGTNISVPLSPGLDMTIPVDEVEVVNEKNIKIKAHCDDLAEVEFLLDLKLDGKILSLE
ncbi:hypothetical protein ACO0LF_19230 [Undibacterium sp. Di27W]|uniref:hypothetical protein n=1 Tax=Undibacterium sp. Di27W TaxID=3413036 RepID=UPI003BF451B7